MSLRSGRTPQKNEDERGGGFLLYRGRTIHEKGGIWRLPTGKKTGPPDGRIEKGPNFSSQHQGNQGPNREGKFLAPPERPVCSVRGQQKKRELCI